MGRLKIAANGPFIKAALDGVLPGKKYKRQIEHMQGTLHHAHEQAEHATQELETLHSKYDTLVKEKQQLQRALANAQAAAANMKSERDSMIRAHEKRVAKLEAELRLQEAYQLQYHAERMATELETMQLHAEHNRRLGELEADLLTAREMLQIFIKQQSKLRAQGGAACDMMASVQISQLENKCRDLHQDLETYMQLNAFLRQENNEKTLALQSALNNLYQLKKKTSMRASPRRTRVKAASIEQDDKPAVEYIECTSSSDSEDLNNEPQYVNWDNDQDAVVFQNLHGLIQKQALKSALTPLKIPKTHPTSHRVHHAKGGNVRKRSPRGVKLHHTTKTNLGTSKASPASSYCL
ncbi:hypothetical protein THRCLA_01376 [Thraustotheca clavata]|uniref:Uncharacterized protein n=1 Tax=Thraustotheca clavata TaxID=74557 RepID=A0A1W0A8E5_9STRA|nr:hypothetical protein THRCLA_01376 [Thraustotheca clavata]